jgi:hypothetical protein
MATVFRWIFITPRFDERRAAESALGEPRHDELVRAGLLQPGRHLNRRPNSSEADLLFVLA